MNLTVTCCHSYKEIRMYSYASFYITKNDVKLMKEVLESLNNTTELSEYDRQSFHKLTSDMDDAIEEIK